MIDEIQARLNKATKGEWAVNQMPDASGDGSTYPYVSVRENKHGCDIEQIFSENEIEDNLTFIAHAPEDIKRLLAEVEKLKKTPCQIENCPHAGFWKE